MSVRLQKFMAHAGVASRRRSEQLIVDGRVTVNGRIVRELGTTVDPERDAVKVDGRRVVARKAGHTYILLHKPRGYVTTLSDPENRPTVKELLPRLRARVYPVGRLDFHSEGLLLLTDDGDLARDLMHPSRGVPKHYRVKVRGVPGTDTMARLSRGMLLDGRKTRPARFRVAKGGNNAWLDVTMHEGRTRQVRRMLAAVGHPVVKLRRVGFGPLSLAGLAPGKSRRATAEEVGRLRRAVEPPRRGAGRRGCDRR